MVALLAALALVAAPRPVSPAEASQGGARLPRVVVVREHDLASPTGAVSLTWPSLALDSARGEAFVIAEGFVRIFNSVGMETFRFGDDGRSGGCRASRCSRTETSSCSRA